MPSAHGGDSLRHAQHALRATGRALLLLPASRRDNGARHQPHISENNAMSCPAALLACRLSAHSMLVALTAILLVAIAPRARAAEGKNDSGVVVVEDFAKGADAWKPTD